MKVWIFKTKYEQNTEEIAFFQKHYVDYLANEHKNNSITIIKNVENMTKKGTRPDCCYHVIKVAAYSQMEIHHCHV